MLQLIHPDISHKDQWEDIISEWNSWEKYSYVPWPLFRGEDFDEFFSLLEKDRNGDNFEKTTRTLFFCFDDSLLVWALELRHDISHENFYEVGGHIGFCVRPTQRRKWYAKEILRLGLNEARKLWISKVLLTCSDDNIWSYKTIESNGWIFERFSEKDGVKKRRYGIDLYREEKEILIQLEIELLSFECRHNPDRIEELLADDFLECGKHGDRFGKREVLEWLPTESDEKKFETRDMAVHMLSESIGQVWYLCTIENPWESPTTSFRSSLWRKREKWWQMFFHQGTLIW